MSQTSPNPQPARVSCGRHYAANCSTCPWKVSAEGVRGRWMGHKYCNGACEWRWHGRINAGGTCVSKPAPTPPAITVTDGTSSTRGTVTAQITGGTVTQFSTSARSSEVQDALRHVVGAHGGGLMVSPSMDLFDVCGISAHRMRSAHASDLGRARAPLGICAPKVSDAVVQRALHRFQPTHVIHLAANVGGLFKNMKYRVSLNEQTNK